MTELKKTLEQIRERDRLSGPAGADLDEYPSKADRRVLLSHVDALRAALEILSDKSKFKDMDAMAEFARIAARAALAT